MLITELSKIFKFINQYKNVLIHTDVLKSVIIKTGSRQEFLNNHYHFLNKNIFDTQILFPSFNYDFCRNGIYNMKEDQIKVGILNEHIRNNYFEYRTPVPIFSFISKMNAINFDIDYKKDIDPFNQNSLFEYLYNDQSCLFHYGSDFSATTLIHYSERIFGGLVYRYDKFFEGKIIDLNKNITKVKVKYHVRPMNFDAEYDWDKIKSDLKQNNLILEYKDKRTVLTCFCIKDVVDYWLDNLKRDKLYFLKPEGKILVSNKLSSLGRKFELRDFEV